MFNPARRLRLGQDKLWDELTAAQHLNLFGRFKGVSRENLQQYTLAALDQFGLQEEAVRPDISSLRSLPATLSPSRLNFGAALSAVHVLATQSNQR